MTYLENNKAGITVFGFTLDRSYLHTIFMLEWTLFLWLLVACASERDAADAAVETLATRFSTEDAFATGRAARLKPPIRTPAVGRSFTISTPWVRSEA